MRQDDEAQPGHEAENGFPGTQTVQFFSGWEASPETLRGQIYDAVKAALPKRITTGNLWGSERPEKGACSVSLFPHLKADVLITFDLSDRDQMFTADEEGQPPVKNFGKLMVPGRWFRDRLLSTANQGVSSSNIIITGSPRIDVLRRMQASREGGGSTTARRPRVLYVPLHGEWRDDRGFPMSSVRKMAPFSDKLNSICNLTVQVDQPNIFEKEPVTEPLLDADVVITDYASVMYEAWALGKPVIFPRWLLGDRVLDVAPDSAEARVYRDGIGYHAESFEHLSKLIGRATDLEIGADVEALMEDMLDNYRDGNAAEKIAASLSYLSDPIRLAQEAENRAQIAALMQAGQWADATDAIAELLIWNPGDIELHDQQAIAYNKLGKLWQEVTSLEQASQLSPRDAGLHFRLGRVCQKLGRDRDAAEAFAAAIALAPDAATSDLYYRLGYAHEQASASGDGTPAEAQRAAAAYVRAIALSEDEDVKRFGVGLLHTNAGRWREAARAYAARVKISPLDDELYFKLGMAHDRCYDWAEAEAAYRRAIALNPKEGGWHFRLGFVLERQEHYDGAVSAYLYSAEHARIHRPQRYYRAGYVLEKLGRFEEACQAYANVPEKCEPPKDDNYQKQFAALCIEMCAPLLETRPEDPDVWARYSDGLENLGDRRGAARAVAKAALYSPTPNPDYAKRLSKLEAAAGERRVLSARLEHNCTRPTEWLRFSEILEADGALTEAIEAMQQAVMRTNAHDPALFHRLGMLLQLDGRFEEAARAYRDQSILQRPHGIYEQRFKDSADLRETGTYRELYECTDIIPNSIMYESYSGVSLSCSPRALYDKISETPKYKDWLHIWVIKPDTKIPDEMRGKANVFFVERDSYLYMRYLATAEYLVNNATFPYYFICRDEQKYLNTWHGTPLKHLGADIKDEPLARANTVRNFLQCTHIIYPNDHTCHVMTDRNLVGPSLTAQRMISGYPRIDGLVNASDAEKQALRDRLGIGAEERVVLFAPSYRGYWSSPEIEVDQLIETLTKLDALDARILFRGHYFAEQAIRELDLPVDVISSEIDSCRILSVTDVLITDYSSIFYDFLPSRRPIFHLVEDWDLYEETRGVYFGKDELPGTVCETTDVLFQELEAHLAAPQSFKPSARYEEAIKTFSPHEDGKVTERVLDFWIEGNTEHAVRNEIGDKAHVGLYIGSVDKNGITSSCTSLIKNLFQKGYLVTAFVNRPFIGEDPAKVERMRNIGKSAEVIIRTGRNCTTPEEQWLTDKFNAQHHLYSEEQYQTMFHGMALENRRSFGRKAYDLIVDADGYSPFLTNLMGMMSSRRKVAMLHNDMYAEMVARFPHLRRAFQSYRHFDKLISVSESVSEVNGTALSQYCEIAPDVFDFATNTLDFKQIRLLAEECLDDPDLDMMRADTAFKLINMARLSPEKSQDRLLTAVRILRNRGHDVSAYILGKGPIRRQVEKGILDLDLKDHVHLLGIKENPYPFLKLADSHVLSSSYEGQGIVLLEAMTLGVPCVSTDIPGPQSVLRDGLGILTDETPEALADGIEQYIERKFEPRRFDPETYNDDALQRFLNAAGLKT